MKRFALAAATRLAAATGLAATLGLTACATTPGAQGPDPRLQRMMAGESEISGSALDKRVAAAAAHPLGSEKNPVRAASPTGQRAYLARLRCSNGQAPAFSRDGSMGDGVFGNIIDAYTVDCGAAAPARVKVYMDMYHRGHVEARAVPGFTIMPGGPVA